jgi:hypothetical protein
MAWTTEEFFSTIVSGEAAAILFRVFKPGHDPIEVRIAWGETYGFTSLALGAMGFAQDIADMVGGAVQVLVDLEEDGGVMGVFSKLPNPNEAERLNPQMGAKEISNFLERAARLANEVANRHYLAGEEGQVMSLQELDESLASKSRLYAYRPGGGVTEVETTSQGTNVVTSVDALIYALTIGFYSPVDAGAYCGRSPFRNEYSNVELQLVPGKGQPPVVLGRVWQIAELVSSVVHFGGVHRALKVIQLEAGCLAGRCSSTQQVDEWNPPGVLRPWENLTWVNQVRMEAKKNILSRKG